MAQRRILEMFEKDPAGSHLYARLLSEASISDRTVTACGQLVDLKRGQLVFGRAQWADKTGISENVIRRIMKQLEQVGEIHQLNKVKFSVVSVLSITSGDGDHQQKHSTGPAVHHSKNKEYGKENNPLVASKLNDEQGATSKADNVPHQEIIKLYALHLPNLPQPRIWTDKRKKALKARWHSGLKSRDGTPINSLSWWGGYFQHVKGCPHLMGKNDRGWTADLEWLVNESNLLKVIEGKYA